MAGAPAAKPGRQVAPAEPVVILGPPPRFVSRGGDKLDAALERLQVEVAGQRALDAGASTGGFTDCLLARGASQVVALDVGRGQLHARLRNDPRVVCRERTNLRRATLADLDASPFPVIVADLSFISLTTVGPVLVGELAGPGAEVVVLVKPQFEAGRAEVSRGRGVISEPAIWRAALERVASCLTGCGAAIMGAMPSPLTGADGNVEFFLHCRPATSSTRRLDLDEVVAEAQARHGSR